MKLLALVLSQLLTVLGEPVAPAPKPGARIREAGTGLAVADVELVVLPAPDGQKTGRLRAPPPVPHTPAWLVSAHSDAEGLVQLPEPFRPAGGRVWLIVRAPGFHGFHAVLEHEQLATGDYTIWLRPNPQSAYRTTVVAAPRPHPASESPRNQTRVLDRQLMERLPGAWGDPIRSLQLLPGVLRPPAGLAVLSIRGLPPRFTTITYEGHRLPRATHVLGLSSIVSADILDELRLTLGSPGPEFGPAFAGLLELKARPGRRDRVHVDTSIDLLRAAARVEGPVGQGSYLVAARRAFLDGVLRPIYRRNGGEGFPLPSYFDLAINFDYPLGQGRKLEVRALGFGDRLSREIDLTGASEDFIEVQHLRRHNWQLTLAVLGQRRALKARASVFARVDNDRTWQGHPRFDDIFGPLDEFELSSRRLTWGTRLQLSARTSSRLSWRAGVDGEMIHWHHETSGELPSSSFASAPQNPLNKLDLGLTPQQSGETQSTGDLSLFAAARFELGPLELDLGTRFTGHYLVDRLAFAAQPRGLARLHLGPKFSVSVSGGLHALPQLAVHSTRDTLLGSNLFKTWGGVVVLPDTLQRLISARTLVTPEPRAIKLDTGYGGSFSLTYDSAGRARHTSSPWRWRAEASTYAYTTTPEYKRQIPPRLYGDNRNFGSGGRIDAGGFELMLRLGHRAGFRLLASYGLNAARHRDALTEDGWLEGKPSGTDQRHMFSAAIQLPLAKHWHIGLRMRAASGLPYTAFGLTLVDTRFFEPHLLGIEAPTNGARLPWAHQLDLRVDKSWYLRRSRLSAYLDVQNVYGHANAEGWLYSHDLQREVAKIALPILPSIGLRWQL